MQDTDVGSLPFVVLLAAVTIVIIRSREVRWHIAALIWLCGFYTGLTPEAEPVAEVADQFVTWLVSRF